MHRSWLRRKIAQGAGRATDRVSQRARTLIPIEREQPVDSCMVCGRRMRPHRLVRGEGRVCSPACARSWAEGLQ